MQTVISYKTHEAVAFLCFFNDSISDYLLST